MLNLKKGAQVKIISGKDKGKTGEILEINRGILKEGNSILVTLLKNLSTSENGNRRINIKKITLLKDVINKPINKAIFTLDNPSKVEELRKLLDNDGHTDVELNILHKKQKLIFKIKGKKKVDRNLINTLKNKDILTSIS